MKQQPQNLLERLKPEHRVKLNELEESYPSTIGIIKRELEETDFWIDLRFQCAIDICSMFNIELSQYNIATLFNENEPDEEFEIDRSDYAYELENDK